MKFTSFYVHNRCSPTRAALMTGCHANRVGVDSVVYRSEKIGLHADEITIAELLRKAGYATGMVGKWHLGEWDEFDLSKDMGEASNIAMQQPEEHKRLYAEMMAYFKEVGARIPKPNPDFDPAVYKDDKGYAKRVLWGPFEGKRALEEDEK